MTVVHRCANHTLAHRCTTVVYSSFHVGTYRHSYGHDFSAMSMWCHIRSSQNACNEISYKITTAALGTADETTPATTLHRPGCNNNFSVSNTTPQQSTTTNNYSKVICQRGLQKWWTVVTVLVTRLRMNGRPHHATRYVRSHRILPSHMYYYYGCCKFCNTCAPHQIQ
jgi:hypothetical protein